MMGASEVPKEAVLRETCEMIRKQSDQLQSWTRTLLTVQAGAVAGLGFMWTSSLPFRLKYLSTIGIAFLAILGTVVSCAAAIGDLKWQGRYIIYVKELDDTLYRDLYPKPGGWGKRARTFFATGIALVILWLVVAVGYASNWMQGIE